MVFHVFYFSVPSDVRSLTQRIKFPPDYDVDHLQRDLQQRHILSIQETSGLAHVNILAQFQGNGLLSRSEVDHGKTSTV